MIEAGEVFAGSLPARALRLVREWLDEHGMRSCQLGAGAWPATKEIHCAAEMSEMIKIQAVELLEGYWLRLTFSDGAIKDVDLGGVLAGGRVVAPIRDRQEVFEQVRVNPETQTIEWPREVDLDPEVLYGRFEPASGAKITRRTVREPTVRPHYHSTPRNRRAGYLARAD